jgi:hypothetical protein
VQLKADKEQPKPIWWSVDDAAWRGGGGNTAFDIYKAILNEFDKKRVVLVWLSPSTTPAEGLRCRALRFQSPELGGR